MRELASSTIKVAQNVNLDGDACSDWLKVCEYLRPSTSEEYAKLQIAYVAGGLSSLKGTLENG